MVARDAPQTPVPVHWKRGFTSLDPKPDGVRAVGRSDVRPALPGLQREHRTVFLELSHSFRR